MTTINQRPLANNFSSTPLGGRTISGRAPTDSSWQTNNGRLLASSGQRYYASEPRELNEDELLMDDDGEQILVYGRPTGSEVIPTRWQPDNFDTAHGQRFQPNVTESVNTRLGRSANGGLANERQRQLLSVDCNNSDYLTSNDDVIGPLPSPLSALSPSGRRSGIPVPTWQYGELLRLFL